MKGRLIIVNGGSSVGKSSLCKAFQDQAWERRREAWMLLGIDSFWSGIPPKQLDLERADPEFYTQHTYLENDLPYFVITPGPLLDQAMYARYRAIQAYLDFGMNVIADDVIWKVDWLRDTVRLLEGYEVHFVAARVLDIEGAWREMVRGDRVAGWDRGSAHYAHRDCVYDLEIDTTEGDPAVQGGKLISYLEGNPQPTAFAHLRNLLAD